MEGALKSHLHAATGLSQMIGNSKQTIRTSPRASALAPRRSKKHSTAPRGSAMRRMVPNCGAVRTKQGFQHMFDSTNGPANFTHQSKHEKVNPCEKCIRKVENE